jgi:serine/threonine-protein kinase
VDGRADLWSLGIILHELLTCSLPFEADSLAGTLAAIAADDPLPLRAVAPDAPEPLEGVILTCLAKAPKERFASVAELATALAPFAPEDGLVRARRISRLLGAAISSPPEAAATPRPASDSATSGTVPSWEGETEAQPRRAGMLGWRPAAASAIVVASTVAFFAFRGQPEVRSPVPAASTRSAVASGSTGVEASPPSNPAAALQSAPIAPALSASGDSNAPARPPAKGGPPKPHTGAPPAGTTRPKTKPKDPNDDGTTDRK